MVWLADETPRPAGLPTAFDAISLRISRGENDLECPAGFCAVPRTVSCRKFRAASCPARITPISSRTFVRKSLQSGIAVACFDHGVALSCEASCKPRHEAFPRRPPPARFRRRIRRPPRQPVLRGRMSVAAICALPGAQGSRTSKRVPAPVRLPGELSRDGLRTIPCTVSQTQAPAGEPWW